MNRGRNAGALSISPGSGLPWRKLLDAFPKQEARAAKTVRSRGRKIGMDITWVTDRIGVGGGIWNAENMAAVARAGITHIIDMQIEFDDTPLAKAHGIAVCWNPVDDDFEPKEAEVFERGVEFGELGLGSAACGKTHLLESVFREDAESFDRVIENPFQ